VSRRHRSAPIAVLPAALLALLLVVAGCTSGTTETPTTSTLASTATPPTAATPSTATSTATPTATATSGTASGSAAASGGTASAAATSGADTAFAGDFVTRSGRQLILDGDPFRFVGANLYDAAATDRYSCNTGKRLSDADLLTTLRYLHDKAGATVLRFWAYQTYTQGGTDFSGTDRVIAAAKAVGMKVLPVLEDGPGNCTNSTEVVPKSKYQNDTWFSAGYKVPFGNATLSYRDYVKVIAAHYANEPAIIAWSMMNEADTSARDSSGRSVLVDFATDIVGVIKSVDTRHLITVGTQSNGAPGASGPDFTAVYGVPGVDLAEVHDWGYWGSDQSAMPGGEGSTPPAADSPACKARNAPVGCSFALAAGLDKPLFVGEAGILGRTPDERSTRATELRAKMDAAFGAGAVGYLVWSINTAITDGYDVLISDDDPLIGQLQQVARQLS
jgi:mannan endo-1,4-beta-mannosidase